LTDARALGSLQRTAASTTSRSKRVRRVSPVRPSTFSDGSDCSGRPGQVANRVVTVGDPARLHRFKRFLDAEPKPFEHTSARGYTTVTGRYKGVPMTLIAIGMGVSMVDFFVREVRAVVEGDLAIIRFGSCGSLDPSLPVGSIGVPEKALQISTNYAHWHGDAEGEAPPYLFSPPVRRVSRLLGLSLFSTDAFKSKDSGRCRPSSGCEPRASSSSLAPL